MTAPGSASFVTSRENRSGIYTDFAPPNLLLSTLGIAIGTLVKQTDHQIHVPRAQPLASDFNPPNLLTGTFIKPAAPFAPAPTADNALYLWARWNATDFAPPNLLGRLLGPAPLQPVDTMGDAWSAGKTSFRGVYSDFIAPNLVLTLPPLRVGPYVPVETGVEINRRNVYRDFVAPNILLNSIALIGAGNSFPGKSLDGWCPRSWAATDFAPPNFQTTTLQTKPPFVPPEYLGLPLPARAAATDFQAPNFLTSTATLFFGNPPKVSADPSGYAVRPRGIYDDSPPQNFLTGSISIPTTKPLSALDDMAQTIKGRFIGSDFLPPNLITGTLIAAAPPQPPAPITTPIPGLQLLPYTFPDAATAYRRISEVVNRLVQGKSAGTYNPLFKSGQVQYVGPGGQLAGSNDLIFGELLPNPAGTPGPALLAGSGGGGGNNIVFWFITDQAFDTLSPGNDIYHTAGETQPGSTARGGNWTVIAGASDGGLGGQALIQGGTSVTNRGGSAVLQGGNSTGKAAPPGDAFVIAGLVGNTGGNVHLVATLPDGSSVYGVIRHRGNSTIRWDEFVGDGSWFFYDGSGFGSAGAPVISKGPGQPVGFATDGFSGTFTTNDGRTATVVQGRITRVI